jgi:hypothetical protein
MNNDFSRLRHTQKQESLSEQQQEEATKSQAKEFASVEELIREDVAQTAVPPTIAARLNESIAQSPKPKAWWKQFFSRE